MTTSDLEAIRPLIEDIMGAMGFELVQLEPKGAGFYFSWRQVDGRTISPLCEGSIGGHLRDMGGGNNDTGR